MYLQRLISRSKEIIQLDDKSVKGSKYIRFKIKSDRKTQYIGQLDDYYVFVIIILLFTTGYRNAIDFPNLVYEYGGALFICYYLIIAMFFSLPLYILEMGLAQFYSESVLHIYNIVPLFQGIGWTMISGYFLTIISFSTKICPTLMYIGYLFYRVLPWTTCRNNYQLINCTKTFSFTNETNGSISYLTSDKIFFEIEIEGLRNPETGNLYIITDKFGKLRIPYLFAMISVWTLATMLSCVVVRLYVRFLYYFFIFLILIMVIMTIRTIFLPGSIQSLTTYLYPDMNKTFGMVSMIRAIYHCIYSSCIGSAVLSEIASINKFNYNFYKAARLIIICNFLIGTFLGIMQFSALGYEASTRNKAINPFDSNNIIDFHTFVRSVSPLPDGRILIFLYVILLSSLGIFNIAIGMAGFVISLIRKFPELFQYSDQRKMIACLISCLIPSSFSLLFSINGMMPYRRIIDLQLEYIAIPLIILNELIIVNFLYGLKKFRSEMKMMLGVSYNFIWAFSSACLVPAAICICLTISIHLSYTYKSSTLSKVASYFVTFLLLIPLCSSAIKVLYESSRKSKGLNIFFSTLKAPEIMGPYYKANWLLGKTYRKKLVKLRDDPKFLKTIRETEDLNKILERLRNILKNEKLKKIKSEEKVNVKPKIIDN